MPVTEVEVAEAVEAAPAVSPEAEVVEVALEADPQLWRPVFASC